MQQPATFMVDARARISAWDAGAADLMDVSRGRALGRPCYHCVALSRSSEEQSICAPTCPLLLAAERREVKSSQSIAFVATPQGMEPRLLCVSVFQQPQGGWSILHILKPLHGVDRLTRSESGVLALLDRGLSTEDIAERMDTKQSTVRTHVRHILEKLGVESRVEALAAVRRGAL